MAVVVGPMIVGGTLWELEACGGVMAAHEANVKCNRAGAGGERRISCEFSSLIEKEKRRRH